MSTRALQGAQHLNPAGHLLRVLSAPWRVARYAWVRSLQARVVMGTLVLCALVTALVGWMLMRQIADGLVEDKRDQSVAQAQAGITDAQQQLDASVASDTDSQSQVVRQLVTSLSSRTGSPPGYELVLEGPLGPGAGTPSQDAGLYTTPEGSPDSIPVDLRTTVETQPGTWWSYSRLVSDDGGLHRFVNVYVNDEDVRFLGGLDTTLSDGDNVTVLPAVAGGAVPAVAGG